MSKYQYHRGYCILCGKDLPKRDMNKIMISYSHSSVTCPRMMCSVCDDCLPQLFDNLGVKEPEREINWGKPPAYCMECGTIISKTALYCKSCGAKLKRSDKID